MHHTLEVSTEIFIQIRIFSWFFGKERVYLPNVKYRNSYMQGLNFIVHLGYSKIEIEHIRDKPCASWK